MKFPRIVVSRRAAGAGEKEALLMVRSIWRKAVFGALASTGLALGQQAAPPAATTVDPACRYVTVAEMGKPGQRCKVLAEWRMADGSLARQVESVDTGERMTIVETGVLSDGTTAQNGGRIKAVASRIFHWGKSQTAPPGTPIPPESAAPALAAKPNDQPTPPQVAAKPKDDASAPRVKPTDRPASSTVAAKPKDDASPPKGLSSYLPRIFGGGKDKSSCCTPVATGGPLVVQGKDPAPAPNAAGPIVVQGKDPSPAPAATGPTIIKGSSAKNDTAVAQVQASDWRKSWGKLSDGGSTTKSDAPAKKVDPLSDPLPYTKAAVEGKMNDKMNLSKPPADKAKAADPLPPLPPLAKDDLPPLPSGAKDDLPPLPSTPQPLPPLVEVQTPPPAPMPEKTRLPRRGAAQATITRADDDGITNARTPQAPANARPSPAINAFPAAPQGMPQRPGMGQTGMYPPSASNMLPPPEPVSMGVVQAIYGDSAEEREKLLRVLRDSIYPSQREWAADHLSEYDWKQNASIVDALVVAAKDDPAATVRAGCVRNLTRMHVNTVPVVVAIQSLKTDADPRVRTQVQEALGILASGLPMAVEPAPLPEPVKPQ